VRISLFPAGRSRAALVSLSLLFAPLVTAAAQGGPERIAVDSAGVPATSFSETASLSDDGRFVAFVGFDSNLAPGEGNNKEDIFVRDRLLGTTERVAPGANAGCFAPAISGDGRYVAFVTSSTNLVQQDLVSESQVLLFDRQTGVTELISRNTSGVGGDQGAGRPAISDDGRFVSFQSYSNDIVVPDVNFAADIYVRDRLLNTTELVSISTTGQQTAQHSYSSAVSPNGRFVVFEARGDVLDVTPNGYRDIFRRDRLLGVTEQVSFGMGMTPATGHSHAPLDISDDGRFVAFQSEADNLVAGQLQEVYPGFAIVVRDMQLGTNELISLDPLSPSGAELLGSVGASMSGDGRYVGFASASNGRAYRRDRVTDTTLRLDVSGTGVGGNGPALDVALSDASDVVAWTSSATNLVAGDTNGAREVFARSLPRAGELVLSGHAAGVPMTVTATGLVPSTVLLLGVSLTGPGPLPSSFGLVDLGWVPSLFVLTADAGGQVSFGATLPTALIGAPLWVQGLDLFSGLLTPAIGTFVE
jgi:hypothetical protein